ncbi:TPA: hypothetical protein ACN1V3_001403 [Staphylococcus aureus]
MVALSIRNIGDWINMLTDGLNVLIWTIIVFGVCMIVSIMLSIIAKAKFDEGTSYKEDIKFMIMMIVVGVCTLAFGIYWYYRFK